MTTNQKLVAFGTGMGAATLIGSMIIEPKIADIIADGMKNTISELCHASNVSTLNIATEGLGLPKLSDMSDINTGNLFQ